MTTPDSNTTPATPTELAELYLRARDVPCLKCGYNRRDGTAAACPECGHHLRLGTVRNRLDIAITRTAVAVSITIACCAVIVCGGIMLLLLQYRPDVQEFVGIILLLTVICCTIFGVKHAVKSRSRGDQQYLQRFIGMTGVAAVLFTIAIVMSLGGGF